MPLDQGYLAQNVRRLAGMHLVSMDALARYVGVSRPTLQAMVAQDPSSRSFPRAETSLRIAEAFGVSLNALYSEPMDCLREAIEHLYDAPITEVVEAPPVGPGAVETFAKVTKAQAEAVRDIGDARRARPKRTRRKGG